MKRYVPNFLTCCNLICGALGIIHILRPQENSIPALYFVIAACIFDFFDGFAARAMKVTSSIGKELDSLADMVSFGILPAVFMFSFISQHAHPLPDRLQAIVPYSALAIAVFSALRLAIFNVDETQKESFRGLPTPANSLFITGLGFMPVTFHPWVLVLITAVFSLLLVSGIELFALKFTDFRWNSNRLKFIFLIISALALIILKLAAIPVIILFYIGLSLGRRAVA